MINTEQQFEIEKRWAQLMTADGLQSRMRHIRDNTWGVYWRIGNTALWHKAVEGSLDYLDGYIAGRFDGQGVVR